jgi:hypothetical protein
VAREKIDPNVSRKAYAYAEKRLREAHEAEFAQYVDIGYIEQGFDSPRMRRAKAAEAAEERRLLNAQKRERRQQEKIEAAAALLREAGIEVALPLDVAEDVA